MGWFDDNRDAHQQVYGDERHEGKFSHELIGGAAAFEGMKLFEDRQRREGKVVSHSFAKELLAGFAGAEVDKLVETKGMDEYDAVRAKRHARDAAENMYDQHYGQDDQYNPDQRDQPNFNY
ncbi:uncharacterized protein A1O9_09061 [Exophiala aquamarina CBS 119918]|uniref:CipC-like antibiotic response protein n=1 Tax=Exophiala aquamarina CBS 119918 TaxID=1182545 RepID=A0A072P3B4_9EURO|nr:uncharacterized protein A1O9_09061 [Exophiala aquamarina CBS 119918]KEF54619.1 hypothetical protein A1O9_09061 [Exophiala aquamarina CBS 119918]